MRKSLKFYGEKKATLGLKDPVVHGRRRYKGGVASKKVIKKERTAVELNWFRSAGMSIPFMYCSHHIR